jgi:hypothetical protein
MPDGDPIGATSAAALIGGLSEIVTAWMYGHIRADRETLVGDVTTLFVALLDAASAIAVRRVGGGPAAAGR